MRWLRSIDLRDQEILELRVDVVEASQPDVQVLLEYVALDGTGGYALIKDDDEIWLTKYQWVTCGANAPFFYEQQPIRNEGITLSLELKRVGASLELTSRVLDTEDPGLVLFERTVNDTPAVDPTVASFRGYAWSAELGPPIFNGSAIDLGIINVARTSTVGSRVALDNLQYQRRPVLNVERAVRISWPNTFPDIRVLGAPSVQGPWTEVSDPLVESAGRILMTIPAPLSETFRVYRTE